MEINRKLLSNISNEKFFSLNSGTFYLGIDPTGQGIHVGHMMALLICIELLLNNFKGIILIGGFTGAIGDPTGKNKAREVISKDEVSDHASGILNDIKKVFKRFTEKMTFVNNQDWLDKMLLSEYMQIAYSISINKKLHMETFASRIQNQLPLSGTEFLYSDLQMIDFLELHKKHGCNVQIGGADQWGNISFGTHCVQKITKNDDIYGLTSQLLTDDNGEKLSKTGHAPWLSDPYGLLQFFLNISDKMAEKVCDLLEDSAKKIVNFSLKEKNSVNMKKNLTKFFLICYDFENGEKNFINAEERANKIYTNEDLSSLEADKIFEKPSSLLEILVEIGLTSSKSEGRRKMDEKAVKVNSEIINSDMQVSKKSKIQIGNRIKIVDFK